MAEITESQKFFSKFYSKLSESFAVEGKNAVPGMNYLSLCYPGIFIEEDPGKEFEVTWAELLDQAPALNWSYAPNGNQVSKVYGDVIEYHELAEVSLTEAQKQQLAAAKAVLFVEEGGIRKKTALYAEYGEYEARYLETLTAFETARTDAHNHGGKVPQRYVQELTTARGEWSSLGGKTEVETALATINNLNQLNPESWWGQLDTLYKTAKEEFDQGGLLPADTLPSYKSVVGPKGWEEYAFNSEDMAHQESSSIVEAGGSLDCGFLSLGGSYKHEHFESSTDISALKLSMKTKRVEIFRPWLDATVFGSHTWRWPEGHEDGTIAYGGPQSGLPPTMPLLPTGLLVVRDVNLQMKFSHEDLERIRREIAAGGEVGWGPFSLSGSYNESKSSVTSHAELDENGVTIAEPQILGFFCDVLPLCPSPNPELHWPRSKSPSQK